MDFIPSRLFPFKILKFLFFSQIALDKEKNFRYSTLQRYPFK